MSIFRTQTSCSPATCRVVCQFCPWQMSTNLDGMDLSYLVIICLLVACLLACLGRIWRWKILARGCERRAGHHVWERERCQDYWASHGLWFLTWTVRTVTEYSAIKIRARGATLAMVWTGGTTLAQVWTHWITLGRIRAGRVTFTSCAFLPPGWPPDDFDVLVRGVCNTTQSNSDWL